jgi:hypothetical protein
VIWTVGVLLYTRKIARWINALGKRCWNKGKDVWDRAKSKL